MYKKMCFDLPRVAMLEKLVSNTHLKPDQILIKYASTTDQIRTKYSWNTDQIRTKYS